MHALATTTLPHPPRRLYVVSPPNDPNLDRKLREYVEGQMREEMRRPNKLDEQTNTLLAAIQEVKTSLGSRIEVLEARVAGVEARQKLAEAVRPGPHSIPPLASVGRVVHGKEARDRELPSGTWIVDPAAADDWSTKRDDQLKARRWDALLSGLWKVAVTVASAVVIVVLGLLARSLIVQAQHDQPAIVAPAR